MEIRERERLILRMFASGRLCAETDWPVVTWIIVFIFHKQDHFHSQANLCNKSHAALSYITSAVISLLLPDHLPSSLTQCNFKAKWSFPITFQQTVLSADSFLKCIFNIWKLKIKYYHKIYLCVNAMLQILLTWAHLIHQFADITGQYRLLADKCMYQYILFCMRRYLNC